jgi:hypothetical protein
VNESVNLGIYHAFVGYGTLLILVYYLRNLFTGYPQNAAHITAPILHHTQDHPTGEDVAV